MVAPAAVVTGCPEKWTATATSASIVNDALFTPAVPGEDAENLNPVPAFWMLRSAKLATPFTALTTLVPSKIAPFAPVPAAIASVTGPVKLVTTAFDAFSAGPAPPV